MVYEGTQVVGDPASPLPLIICFHGSGDSCASWVPLAKTLGHSCRILLYDRGEHDPKPDVSIRELLKYLGKAQLSAPYVLIAHSYGGAFARYFLQQRPNDVAGMVLAETGQETALDPDVAKQQYRKQILQKKPLSVIRCDIHIGKRLQLEAATRAAQNEAETASLSTMRQMLEVHDKEDERLKKQQLKLSSNSRYVHIPDCGHHVIRDRPDVVAAEVRWVMENLSKDGIDIGLLQKIHIIFRKLRGHI
ncbi:Alpha/Beta hydrolase protein [Xylariales sp. AK1849]|nr:Alpha/Beta hydrolase protein [Xylariales sp. AK1849]